VPKVRVSDTSIIAFITDPVTVRDIFGHLGNPAGHANVRARAYSPSIPEDVMTLSVWASLGSSETPG
jgi:hypothetical protein